MKKSDLPSEMVQLFSEEPSSLEIDSIKFRNRQKILSSNIRSKKKSVLEALKLNFKPIILKILMYIISLFIPKNVKNFKNSYKNLDELGFLSTYRLIHINKLFLTHNPKIIYEFGSGVSTVFFCYLLDLRMKKTGIKGKLISYEQDEKYYFKILKYIPENLKIYLNLNLSNLEYKKYNEYRALCFKIDKYEDEIDLLYVDGPTHKLINNLPVGKQIYQVNGNLIEIIRNKIVKFAFTDHRWNTYPILKCIIKKEKLPYRLKINNVRKSITLSFVK